MAMCATEPLDESLRPARDWEMGHRVAQVLNPSLGISKPQRINRRPMGDRRLRYLRGESMPLHAWPIKVASRQRAGQLQGSQSYLGGLQTDKEFSGS